MSISFDQVPTTNRVPGAYAEIDGSRALSQQPNELHRTLIIGLKLADGSAVADKVVDVQGELGGDSLFGTASQLAAMTRAFRRVNRTSRLYALPILEAGGGTAASGSITLAGTSTAAGSLTVRVGDTRVTVAVPVGTTAADAAALVGAALSAEPRIPATAEVEGAALTLTGLHKGESGNGLTLEAELLPAGLTATLVQPTGGATNPSIAAGLAAVDESRYDTIVCGFSDAANLALLETELARRWGPLVKLPGHGFAAVRGTLGAEVALGDARNSQYVTVMGAGLSPTPPWIWAAQTAGRDAEQTDILPNRPRTGLTLPDCEAPKPGDRLDLSERNQLLYDGISTYRVDPANKVLIERLITTYQQTASGTADATYLSIETVRTLARFYRKVLELGARHERDLIGPDGTAVSPGVPLVTPLMMRGELGALYRQLERDGLVKDTEGFLRELVVELPASDVNRMNVHAAPRIVNGLVTLAIKLSFQL
jgi:phage tail sheath gpL-like